jgi:hypothetical protein
MMRCETCGYDICVASDGGGGCLPARVKQHYEEFPNERFECQRCCIKAQKPYRVSERQHLRVLSDEFCKALRPPVDEKVHRTLLLFFWGAGTPGPVQPRTVSFGRRAESTGAYAQGILSSLAQTDGPEGTYGVVYCETHKLTHKAVELSPGDVAWISTVVPGHREDPGNLSKR